MFALTGGASRRADGTAWGSRRLCRISLAVLAAVGSVSHGSARATSTWNAGSSNWNNPANWTPAGVPGTGAIVDITNTDGLNRVITYDYTGAAVTLGSLTVDLTGNTANADTLSMSADNLSSGTESVGDSGSGSGGVGVISQSGGTNTVGNLDLGVNASDIGSYYLNSPAATLTATTTGYTPYSIIVGDSGIGTMNVSAGSTVNAQQSTIGNIDGSTGNVTLDNSTWKDASFTYVGLYGSGTLTVQNKAQMTSGDVMDIGVFNNASGTLAISGGASVITNTTGINGTSSTVLGVTANTTGTLTIDGAGSVLRSDGDMSIGYAGTGYATITNGGSLLLEGTVFRVGRNAGGNGTLTVDGAGSNVNSSSATIFVGYGGTGTVNIQNQASLAVPAADIGGLNVNAGTGTLSIDGAGTQASLGEVSDGDAGSGTLSVTGGAQVTTGDLTVGSLDTGTGNLVVADAGSVLKVNGLLKVGDAGGGLTEVIGPATVVASSVTIGASATGSGSLGLGTGSVFNTSGDAVLGSLDGTGGNFYIGGAGAAQATVGGNLTVGEGGYGYLTVSGGSTLTVEGGSCAIGAQPTANGFIILTGIAATNTSSGATSAFAANSLSIGGTTTAAGGLGSLSVGSGGVVQVNAGVQIWPQGTLDASGGGAVTIGAGSSAAAGTLQVNHGATLSSTGSVSVIAVINAGTFTQTGMLTQTGNFTNSGTAVIGGAQNWLDGTVFTNIAGTATFQSDAGAAGENLDVNVSGGSVTFAATQHLTGLSLSVGSIAKVIGGGTGDRSVVFTPALSDAGTLDLTANDLDVQAGGVTALSAVSSLIRQGFSNGTWSGTGITSSTAAGDTKHLTAVGVLLNNNSGMPIYLSLDSTSVGVNDVLVKETYYGDANLDGKVDGSDYSRIDSGYLTHSTGWFNGDFNYDGVVNGSDYTLIDNAYNQQGVMLSSAIASPTAQAAPVPEPMFAWAMGLASVGILGRRSRKPSNWQT